MDTSRPDTIPQSLIDDINRIKEDILSNEETISLLEKRKNRKIASGYNLFTFIRHKEPCELITQLIVGSVGTLGIVTKATIRGESYIRKKASMLLYFQNLHGACDAVQHIKELEVAAIEIMNSKTLQVLKKHNPELDLLEGEVHMLLVELEGEDIPEQIEKVGRLLKQKGYYTIGKPQVAFNKEEQEKLWKVRKSIFPLLKSPRSEFIAPTLVNDVGVDLSCLAEFIVDIEDVFEKHNLISAIYGHAGSGNLHIRPIFKRSDENLSKKFTKIADDVYNIVFKYNGTITAEHGMGRVRVPYLKKEWGEKIYEYMKRIKNCFDPEGLLNPDVMFSEKPITEDILKIYQ